MVLKSLSFIFRVFYQAYAREEKDQSDNAYNNHSGIGCTFID